MFRLCSMLVVFALAAGLTLTGQIRSGRISGTVTDATGAVIPDVNVEVVEVRTNQSYKVSTNAEGEFTVPYLPPGEYEIRCEKAGFVGAKRSEIALGVAQNVRLDFKLQVATVLTAVEVSASAAAIQTESATVQGATTERMIQALPNVNQNPLYYAILQMGATPRASMLQVTGQNSFGIGINGRRNVSALSINGGGAFQNDVQVDGVGVVSAPAVSEAWSRAEAQFGDSGAARGGDSARPFIREIIRCLREKQAPEAICAIAVAVCAVHTLASLEAGATGPLRSGSWESLIVKPIRGCPVSLTDAWPWEAQAARMADLWSSGAGVAQTLAECALLSSGRPAELCGEESGGPLPRILSEASVVAIADAIQSCQQPYQRAIAAAYAAANLLIEDGGTAGTPVSAADRALAARVAEDLLLLPESGQALLESLGEKYGSSSN